MANDAASLGREAEGRVAAMLVARGYTIVGTNVRVGRDELDVVAMDGPTLVIIEVRARAIDANVHPFETVTRAKAARLRRAGAVLMARQGAVELRIDVASVRGDEVEFIANAVDFTST